MKRIDLSGALLLLGVLLFVLKPGVSPAAVDHNILFKVGKVKFSGVNKVNKKELAESLVANTPPFWEFWSPHPGIHVKELDDDILKIKQFYQSQGYYQVKASYSMHSEDTTYSDEENRDENREAGHLRAQGNASENNRIPEFDVYFQIHEGAPVIIRDVTIDCLCEIQTISKEQLRANLLLQSGRIFKTDDYEKSKSIIRKLLGNKAYPFARVRGKVTVDLNDNSADVFLDIDPGALYFFGDIHISGNEEYVREEIIHRALAFKSGEKFVAEKLDESRRNLFDLNIFKTAVIKMGAPESDTNIVPIDIQIKPRKKRSVKLGVGYGTDDGLRLQGSWSYRNLTGWADRLTFRTRRSDILENIYAEYFLPYFLSARNNLVTTAGYEREIKDYYTLQRIRSEINFYHKLGPNWFSSLGYTLEGNRPEDIHIEEYPDILDLRDTENYLVSAVKFNIEHNTIDDVLNSQKGGAVSLSIEHASRYLGSEIAYIRPGIDARGFVPLPWGMVLAGRMDFKTIQKSGDTDYIPLSRQFFLGGSKSVRGFGFEELGVIDRNDVIQDISGLSSFVGNVELRFPVYDPFGGVMFIDTGALNKDAFEMDFKSLRYTCGLGLRYHTIIGPIQLDFGYQLNPATSTVSDDPLLTDLLNKDRWYLHFNIGQTF